jgi:hypothetical protein
MYFCRSEDLKITFNFHIFVLFFYIEHHRAVKYTSNGKLSADETILAGHYSLVFSQT